MIVDLLEVILTKDGVKEKEDDLLKMEPGYLKDLMVEAGAEAIVGILTNLFVKDSEYKGKLGVVLNNLKQAMVIDNVCDIKEESKGDISKEIDLLEKAISDRSQSLKNYKLIKMLSILMTFITTIFVGYTMSKGLDSVVVGYTNIAILVVCAVMHFIGNNKIGSNTYAIEGLTSIKAKIEAIR